MILNSEHIRHVVLVLLLLILSLELLAICFKGPLAGMRQFLVTEKSLTLYCIMLKNGQTYFKNLAV